MRQCEGHTADDAIEKYAEREFGDQPALNTVINSSC